ncbi:uncharacterized protein LOC103967863 isoform X2 [Pyrus x bretschneideri]|uniref:uncharacterized protein LOC103967863 isoform X2 n=1 Tax=Pyrus x bretschneideri TaxID=225117 RepID=UPI00202F487F|nr:uncharacterized protein LOC103967863 isoform X2 [Pyrus x bretschneideri]
MHEFCGIKGVKMRWGMRLEFLYVDRRERAQPAIGQRESLPLLGVYSLFFCHHLLHSHLSAPSSDVRQSNLKVFYNIAMFLRKLDVVNRLAIDTVICFVVRDTSEVPYTSLILDVKWNSKGLFAKQRSETRIGEGDHKKAIENSLMLCIIRFQGRRMKLHILVQHFSKLAALSLGLADYLTGTEFLLAERSGLALPSTQFLSVHQKGVKLE